MAMLRDLRHVAKHLRDEVHEPNAVFGHLKRAVARNKRRWQRRPRIITESTENQPRFQNRPRLDPEPLEKLCPPKRDSPKRILTRDPEPIRPRTSQEPPETSACIKRFRALNRFPSQQKSQQYFGPRGQSTHPARRRTVPSVRARTLSLGLQIDPRQPDRRSVSTHRCKGVASKKRSPRP